MLPIVKWLRQKERRQPMIRATVTPHKCDDPERQYGQYGSKLIKCDEHEVRTWVAAINVNGMRLWTAQNTDSTSREAAEAALLKRLAEGVAI